ncbi:MAG: hypothetical protein JOY79_11975, partial [Acidobacteriaceae bacterium]|nr:hypothetical protein [Acidobacteriaceae bacterium]
MSAATQPKFSEEIKTMAREPLAPFERHLIGWSLGLGVALLDGLVWASQTFF